MAAQADGAASDEAVDHRNGRQTVMKKRSNVRKWAFWGGVIGLVMAGNNFLKGRIGLIAGEGVCSPGCSPNPFEGYALDD
jgi:hypothetical protein